MGTNETYNGYKNRQTWSCALWISNDEGLYNLAREYVKNHSDTRKLYSNFIRSCGMEHDNNSDGYKWLSTRIDYKEMNSFMRDLLN